MGKCCSSLFTQLSDYSFTKFFDSFRPHRARTPLVTQRQHAQAESAHRACQSRNGAVQMEPVTGQERRGAECRCNRVELATFKDFWRPSAEDIANAASTHRSHTTKQQRWKQSEVDIKGAGAAGHSEKSERRCVNHDYHAFHATADAGAKNHSGHRSSECSQQVPWIGKGQWRSLLQDKIAGDSATQS